MKLLSQKQTDSIFDKITIFENREMTRTRFNEAVNALLMDAKIVKSLLGQAKRIKENSL